MFVREEQKFILKMLDEGKINAAEAEKLLSALNNNCCYDCEQAKKNFECRLNKFCKYMSGLKGGVCDYINNTVAPNAKKTAHYICEKTAAITKDWADKLKKSSNLNCDDNNNCDNNCGCENNV